MQQMLEISKRSSIQVIEYSQTLSSKRKQPTCKEMANLFFSQESATENIFPYLITAIMKKGQSIKSRQILYSLFNFVKEHAHKIPLELFYDLLLINKEPPFLVHRFQKSNRVRFFPVPFMEKQKKKNYFFFLFINHYKNYKKIMRASILKKVAFFILLLCIYIFQNIARILKRLMILLRLELVTGCIYIIAGNLKINY